MASWRPSLLAFAPTSLGTRPRVGTLTGQQVGRRLPRAPSSRNGGRDHFGRLGEIISGGWAPSSRSAGRHHPGTGGAIILHCRATSPGICTRLAHQQPPGVDNTYVDPLPYQSEDACITYPPLNHLHELFSHDGVEVRGDVQL